MLFLLPRYLPRMLKRGGYARDFRHRFGCFKPLPARRAGRRRVWLQAVSVGEVNAVEPLLRALAARGDVEVVLTTTTSTGYHVAREKLAPFVLATGLFPLDFWLFNRLAWKRIQPDFIILMEGELWPEHLYRARCYGVPVALINARLSDKSFRRYLRFKRVTGGLLDALSVVGVGARNDARRFFHIGIPVKKIHLTGNLKFEAVHPSLEDSTKNDPVLRDAIGFGDAPDAPVLLGSSTWPGEEKMLLEVLLQARARGIPVRLLIVPRHAERRGEIANLLEGTKWKWFLRSQHLAAAPYPADVCVADTTGELAQLTSLATLAFIGKSLSPNDGGQTPIDCAARGVPIVYGPRMTNFREACRGLEVDNGAICVTHCGEAILALLDLLESPEKRDILAQNARRWHLANQGAIAGTLKILAPFLDQGASPAPGGKSAKG
ncbi:MAG: hypothetical protein LBS59_01925 [Puniceicoccales bacterium]|nr:hypothetical protein [Puniceicoccales bacterium]